MRCAVNDQAGGLSPCPPFANAAPPSRGQQTAAAPSQVDWISYDGWGMHVPEGYFRFTTGPDVFVEELRRLGGEDDVRQW